MSPADIVNKLWNYCNVLRDDGMSYGDYVEQLTYLLFLKMADERSKPPYNQESHVPAGYNWSSLIKEDGDDLFKHYRLVLEALGKEKGLLGLIFNKSQNKFQDPAKLRRLIVDLIDKENWSIMSADVKGDAYEGLLEKNAQDTKSGAGQYFTPRPLIRAMVDAIQPKPGEAICDPACGTGGFLLAVHDYIIENFPNMTKDEKRDLKVATFSGWELVQSTARLCAMNLMLHGITSNGSKLPLEVSDSLASDPGETIRRKLLHDCDVHTLLRLPTGLFYAQGVKANVLFFDRKPASETPWTKKLWIYDLRTNKHFTLKTSPLKREDLDEFVKCYNPANRHERTPTWSDDDPNGGQMACIRLRRPDQPR